MVFDGRALLLVDRVLVSAASYQEANKLAKAASPGLATGEASLFASAGKLHLLEARHWQGPNKAERLKLGTVESLR